MIEADTKSDDGHTVAKPTQCRRGRRSCRGSDGLNLAVRENANGVADAITHHAM
jgi:hypothetical protein